MKDFKVSVFFKPILKIEWFGSNREGDQPFNQYRYADINDTLVVDLKYEKRKFVTCYVTARNTGMVHAIITDEADAKLVQFAIEEAKKRAGEPRPFTLPEKPKKKKGKK